MGGHTDLGGRYPQDHPFTPARNLHPVVTGDAMKAGAGNMDACVACPAEPHRSGQYPRMRMRMQHACKRGGSPPTDGNQPKVGGESVIVSLAGVPERQANREPDPE